MPGSRFVRIALLIAAGLICAVPAGAAPPPPEILVLSNRADLISGGDALVEIKWPAGANVALAKIAVDGVNVKSAFATRADGRYMGLLTGLKNGANVLTARIPGAGAQVTITNHPITGPVVSGPQLTPYECRLTQNALVAAGDAFCSAVTKVDYFYRASNNTFKVLANPTTLPWPGDLINTTTTDGNSVPYIVRVESGTVNRGVYRLAILDNPLAPHTLFAPGPGWNKKLVLAFDCCGSAQYNQGVHAVTTALSHTELSRGFAYINSTEMWNQQHANAHLQGETAMMLKEYFTDHFGVPKWTVGVGGSGGAIQQYMIAQLFPGLLDGLQPSVSFPDVGMTDVWECRLLNRVWAAEPARWTTTKRNATQGFNSTAAGATTCASWDSSFASIIKSDNAAGCGVTNPANVANIYNPTTNPSGTLRCDFFQTNANLFGTDSMGRALRPTDNIGVQYGLGGLNSGAITVEDFLRLNERVGGYDGDGNPLGPASAPAPRMLGNLDAVHRAYEQGFRNSFTGLATYPIPIITQRTNANARADIHDTLQDLIIRARLEVANGRSDNQIIWASGSTSGVNIGAMSLDLINTWLDNIAADSSAHSTEKVVSNKPALAVDSCWDLAGSRIIEPASADNSVGLCNVVYPRFSTLRMVAGEGMVHDGLKCQLKMVDLADYPPGAFADPANLARLNAIFPTGVCDWSLPNVGQVPSIPWTTWGGGPTFVPLPDPPVSRPIQ